MRPSEIFSCIKWQSTSLCLVRSLKIGLEESLLLLDYCNASGLSWYLKTNLNHKLPQLDKIRSCLSNGFILDSIEI